MSIRKESDRSKLMEARQELAKINDELLGTKTMLNSARDSVVTLLSQRDAANARANNVETRLTDTEVELDSVRTAVHLLTSDKESLMSTLKLVIEDRDFFEDQTVELDEKLGRARTQIRQLRALATVMAVKGVGDLAPAEAAAVLSEGAAYCNIDADDVLAAANTVLPDAYRLSAKVNLELATAPTLPEIFEF